MCYIQDPVDIIKIYLKGLRSVRRNEKECRTRVGVKRGKVKIDKTPMQRQIIENT